MLKGLILKDLLVLKQQGKILLVMMVFYMVLGVAMDMTNVFIPMMVMVSSMLPVTCMAYDERSQWERYALTIPVSRTKIVVEKYLLGLALVAAAVLLGVAGGGVSILMNGSGDWAELLGSIGGVTCVGVYFLSFMLPIIYKLGTEKARIAMIVIFLIPTLLVVLGSKLGLSVSEEMVIQLLKIAPAAALVLFLLSMAVSLSIYKKKEF